MLSPRGNHTPIASASSCEQAEKKGTYDILLGPAVSMGDAPRVNEGDAVEHDTAAAGNRKVNPAAAKGHPLRGMVRRASRQLSASFHQSKSGGPASRQRRPSVSLDRSDSCASLHVCDLEENEETEKSVTTRRPLRRLCRAASSRLMASWHGGGYKASTHTAPLTDSATSLSSTDGNNDDDSSVQSFEGDDDKILATTKRVSFARRARVRPVEHCHYMQPLERMAYWYTRHELLDMKREGRISQAVIQKDTQGGFADVLLDGFVRSQILADCGMDDEGIDILENAHAGQRSAMSGGMNRLCQTTVNGEACRGLEKGLLRLWRGPEARAARDFVLSANPTDDPEEIAREYRGFSRYAVIYAESLAKADALAAH